MSQPAANSAAPADHSHGKGLLRDPNMLIVFGVSLMVVLGVSSVTPAFPKVMQTLQISPAQVSLIITAFTVPGVFLTQLAGILADRVGRKRILVPSLVLFGLAGFACGFAPNLETLLALRFVQGVGAASLGALNITILGDLYEGNRRAAALGYNASALSLGVAFYPMIGGLLAELSWHAPFFLPILALPLALVVQRRLTNPEPEEPQNLKEYLKAMGKGLTNPALASVFFATFLTFVILYGLFITYVPVHLDAAFDFPPSMIGLMMSGTALVMGLAASQAGRLTKHVSESLQIRAAFVFSALSALVMLYSETPVSFALGLALFGAGQAIYMPSSQSLISRHTPMGQRGGIMALNGTVLRLGQTVGPLLMGGAYAAYAIGGVFLTSMGVSLLGFLLLSFLLKRGD